MNENSQTPMGQNPPIIGGAPSAMPQSQPPTGGMNMGTAQTTNAPQPPKSGSMARMLLIILTIVFAVAAGFGGYSYGKTKAPTKIVTKTVAIPALTVPQGATVISQCSNGKGALYALPKDIPTGPVYMVNKGKVIGLEFMVGKDALFGGTNFLNLPMFNQQFDHANIGLLSQGHAGFPVPHYHVDLFTVPDATAKAITCT